LGGHLCALTNRAAVTGGAFPPEEKAFADFFFGRSAERGSDTTRSEFSANFQKTNDLIPCPGHTMLGVYYA